MSISLIGRSVGESVTLKLNETFAILKAKGEPVIHLGGGEPKSKAPIDAITAIASHLNSGEVRYAPVDGTVDMKKAVIRYTLDHYHRKVEPENIVVSSGAKQALMVALQAILDPQDELLYTAPYWVSYPEMARLCGAVPVAVTPEDGTFIPRMKDIEQNISSYTKAIIINNPNNPSGMIYPAEFIKEIVEFTEKKGIYLIMDDIYHSLVFDGKKTANPYDYVSDFSENSKLIVINGVSKAYAMTGFRIGWAVANKKLAKVMANIQGHQTSGPSVLLQKAAIGAINGIQSSVESLRATLENNRNVLVAQLKAFDGVYVTPPDGTFYTFVDFSKYDKDSTRLSNFLLEKVRVLTMPGVEFGMEGYLRLSFCGSIKDITEGIERIKWALDPNSPNELYIGERKLVRDWN
ncbi:MAG: aminotransferase class I/II-fold pyridoxal phosphate-dependent enzyme [Bacteroidales bacterium]|nr:aminotransferase class I/II-fold pyridoxal phosphate-dependent enzyme [Bacteroidales bacterium]